MNDLENKIDRKTNGNNSKIQEQFSCYKCENIFESKKLLKNHMLESHPWKIKCKICNEVFDEKCKLEMHIKAKHQTDNYKCDTCDKEFVLKWQLEKHKKIHNTNKTKGCN